MSMQPDPDLALVEARHRLANCFQLFQSLIRHRLSNAASEEARQHLGWLGEAVAALGLLQQRLLTAGEQGFLAYLEEAVGYWNRLGNPQGVRVVMAVEPGVVVAAGRAASLALVVHELVTNAIEHAFGDGPGEINVEVRCPDGGLDLLVRDGGGGFDASADAGKRLGLDLVRALVRQMGGTFHIDGSAGTTARLVLPPQILPPQV